MAKSPIYAGEWVSEICVIANGDASNLRVGFVGPLTKGARIHAITVSNSDASARVVQMWKGKCRTLQTAAGSLIITGTNTITRTVGSFITDLWRVGQYATVYDPEAASHCVAAAVTAVTATTLTIAGLTNETLSSSARLLHLGSQTAWSVPATSGYATAVPSVALLDTSKNGSIDSQPGRFMTLGRRDVIFYSTTTTVTSPNRVEITTDAGDFEQ